MSKALASLSELIALHDDFMRAQSGHMGNHQDAYSLVARRCDVWDRARSALQEARGSVMVPSHPTWDMLAAARKADWPSPDIYGDIDDLSKDRAAEDVWSRMVGVVPAQERF